MSERQPPPWPDDPLSAYFNMAEYNDRAGSLNYPTVYELLQKTNAALELAHSAVERDGKQELLIPRFLIVRVRSAFLAACRLALSGQIVEAHAVLRVAIEEAWYALHIGMQPPLAAPTKDAPDPKPRWEIWLRRNEDQSSKERCKREFTVKNVRTTHEERDSEAAKALHGLYETLIDFGAHPNEQGVISAMMKSEDKKQITYQVGILAPQELPLMMALRIAVGVAVGALKAFSLLFPDSYEQAKIPTKIEELVYLLNTVFKPWVPKQQS
jgi:hypothetical protein